MKSLKAAGRLKTISAISNGTSGRSIIASSTMMSAALLSSLTTTKGGPLTFTRASAVTVPDYAGVLQTLGNNVPAFDGMRLSYLLSDGSTRGAELSSGGMAVGTTYEITAQSVLDFTTLGSASNAVGTIFKATAAGTLSAIDKVKPCIPTWVSTALDGTPLTGRGIQSEVASTNKCTCYSVPRANSLGAELNPNVAFTTNITGWSGTEWVWETDSVGGGWARKTPGQQYELSRSGLTPGKAYQLTYTIGGMTAGSLIAKIGSTGALPTNNTNGTYSGTLLVSGAPGIYFTPSVEFNGYLDSISLKEAIDYPGTKAYHDGTAFQNPITGMTLSGDTAAVLSIVTDQAAIDTAIAAEIAKGVGAWDSNLLVALQTAKQNGYKVYDFTTGAGGAASVDFTGAMSAVITSIGAVTKVVSGTATLSDSAAANSIAITGAYAVVKKENFTATATRTVRLTLAASSHVTFMAPVLEEQPFVTSLMLTYGTSTTRATTILSEPIIDLPTSGVRHLSFIWTPQGYTARVQQYLWSSYVDVNNFTCIWYNGVIVAMEKRVAGVSEYVTFPLAATLGLPYLIEGYINADNTLGLKVGGVSAGSGLGSELLIDPEMTGGDDWVGFTVNTKANGVLTLTNSEATYATGTTASNPYIGGRLYLITTKLAAVRVWPESIPMRPTMGAITGINFSNTLVEQSQILIPTVSGTAIGFRLNTLADVDIDYYRIKEVLNNSTTLAPILGTTMQWASQNGVSQAQGWLKEAKILRR